MRPRSAETRARILATARDHFSRHGYDRTTIRRIAADAEIDPSMVMRYFGNKERLFAAAAEFELRLPDLSALPPERVGAALVEHFVERWDGDDTLMALLRRGATDPAAADRMREVFAGQLVPVIAALHTDPAEAASRAALAASQILGVALCRYVLCFPPVVDMPKRELVAWVGPTVQRYLTAPHP
ncbi:TetR family transcriptional regulator [Stackebrandtia albiflava]